MCETLTHIQWRVNREKTCVFLLPIQCCQFLLFCVFEFALGCCWWWWWWCYRLFPTLSLTLSFDFYGSLCLLRFRLLLFFFIFFPCSSQIYSLLFDVPLFFIAFQTLYLTIFFSSFLSLLTHYYGFSVPVHARSYIFVKNFQTQTSETNKLG